MALFGAHHLNSLIHKTLSVTNLLNKHPYYHFPGRIQNRKVKLNTA